MYTFFRIILRKPACRNYIPFLFLIILHQEKRPSGITGPTGITKGSCREQSDIRVNLSHKK